MGNRSKFKALNIRLKLKPGYLKSSVAESCLRHIKTAAFRIARLRTSNDWASALKIAVNRYVAYFYAFMTRPKGRLFKMEHRECTWCVFCSPRGSRQPWLHAVDRRGASGVQIFKTGPQHQAINCQPGKFQDRHSGRKLLSCSVPALRLRSLALQVQLWP